MRSGKRELQDEKINHPLPHPNNHFTIVTYEGAPELRNLASLPKPSLQLYYCLFRRKGHYKINRRWQVTFIQNYYEKKLENENQSILRNEKSPPKTSHEQKKTVTQTINMKEMPFNT